MERLGVPTVTLVSTAFEVLARAEADGLGLGGLRILVVPHPVGQRNADVLRSWGEGLVPGGIAALTGSDDGDERVLDVPSLAGADRRDHLG